MHSVMAMLSFKIFIFPIWFQVTSASILDCFKHYSNYYLGKTGNVVVVNITSVNSCLDHCLQSELLYGFVCRSAMVDRMQKECVLSKWSPYLITPSAYHSNAMYTDFYQNICIYPSEQALSDQAPPRTTLPTPNSPTITPLSDSGKQITQNYDLAGTSGIIDITDTVERKKKPPLAAVLRGAQHVPSSSTVHRASYRFIKHTRRTTAAPKRESGKYYANYEEYRNNYDDNDNDEDESAYGDDRDYNINSDPLNDDQATAAADKFNVGRAPDNFFTSVRTIKSAALRPGPVPTHQTFRPLPVPFAKITPFPPTSTTSTTTTTTITITTTTTATTTTSITTTITTVAVTTSNSITSVTPAVHFVPVPVNFPVLEWNTTTKDSSLSIQHRNYTLSVGIADREPGSRRTIRTKLLEQLKCFHYIANRQLPDFEQEVIKHIGLQDCLYNCILRITFLCLSVNYDQRKERCILNGGNRIINNIELIPSKTIDYYEYVCLTAERKERRAESDRVSSYNVTKLRECFSISENAVMYTLNGLVVDNVYTPLECLNVCAMSRRVYRTTCYSVNWFKSSRTCYLHTVRTSIYDLKATTASDFFLNNCASSDTELKITSERIEDDYEEQLDSKRL